MQAKAWPSSGKASPAQASNAQASQCPGKPSSGLAMPMPGMVRLCQAKLP